MQCVIAALAAMTTLSSCDHLYDDLPECKVGVKLRFIYDYNMEWANAFPSQVDCLTLLVYDASGAYVTTMTETRKSSLSDENWRMVVDLDPGKYHLVAYGGMVCDQASFAFVQTPSEGSKLADLRVSMTDSPNSPLHPLFFGSLDIDIPAETLDYGEATVEMMKDTNNIRILLQHVNGQPVDDKDFDFTITDNNTLFAYDNSLLPVPQVTYTPWSRGQVGLNYDGEGVPAQLLAYAEFDTSRFVLPQGDRPGPRLTITRHNDGVTVLSYSLTDLLMLLKSEHFDAMGAQEYLDRESRWDFIFFLDDHDIWISTVIKINDWIVRLNNIQQ